MANSRREVLIVSHLLAVIAGVALAFFAIPAIRHSSVAVQQSAVMSVANATPDNVAIPIPTIAPSPPDSTGQLLIPVQGVKREALTDTYTQARSNNRVHDAIDIMAAEGTPVLAATDGTVVRLFQSNLGGTTIYEFNIDKTYSFYYAHLSAYADGLVEGQAVRRGQVLGYVGHTGNAIATAPHLHFAINALQPNAHWSDGVPVNPYPILRQ